MNRMVFWGAVVLAAILWGGVANAQSMKDIYKSVKKAEFSIEIKASKSFKDAVTDARTEMDLFKGSDEALKNPEFTRHIEAALENIRKAYGLSSLMDQGLSGRIDTNVGRLNPHAGDPGVSSGVENIDKWNEAQADAKEELEAAKRYLK